MEQCPTRRRLLAGAALGMLGMPAMARSWQPDRVTLPFLPANAEPFRHYFYELVELLMRRTEADDGPYVIERFVHPQSNDRAIEALRTKTGPNLLWAGAGRKRESVMRPIRISLLGELNSYRLLLIRAEDEHKFAHVQQLENLRQFKAGMGQNWPDTEFVRCSRLPVVTSLHHRLLFAMLAGRRFDYYPRGLYEVWHEERTWAPSGLMIEPHLMLHWDVPIYFYVHPDHASLAARIERGLKLLMADGSLARLMLSYPLFEKGLREIENPQRVLIRLTQRCDSSPSPHPAM